MSLPEASRRPLPDTDTGIDLLRKLAPGTLVASRYRIEKQIGLGGMGLVYKAKDEELGVDVALKVLRPDLGADGEWVARFRNELVLAREVTHKNVVRIHDIGESGGLRFLTMRFVEGRSLQQTIETGGPLPVERAVKIVRQVAEALEQAHAAGIVHRDLKPGNVLIDAEDNAFVTDFGVATSLGRAGLTRAGAVVGTPDYLAPEQVAGDPVDGRADIYALGILFYEMLTGKLPFAGGSQAEMLAQRLTGRYRDIRETGVQAPPWVRRIIARCLERLPSRRYASARALVADLDRAGAGPPSFARPVAAVAAVALIAAAGYAIARRATPASPVSSASSASSSAPSSSSAPAAASWRRAVAVLPMADETADPELAWTATGVPEMLTTRLLPSADLKVLESERVFRALRDLRLMSGPFDDPTLQRLAGLLEVDTLVAGSIRRAGPVVRMDLRVAARGAGGALETRHLSAEAPQPAALFQAVADLGDRLRADLGGDAPTGEKSPALETTSLEAARADQEARARLRIGDAVGAAPLFEKAVAADAGFAAALEGLSAAYQALGRGEDAVAAARRAESALAPGETRLALRVKARLALLEGDPPAAEKAYAELIRLYPNDGLPRVDLASAQMAQGAFASAVQTLEKATSVDAADPKAWLLLGQASIRSGNSARAVQDHLVRALTLNRQLGNAQGEGDALNAMGVAYHELGKYADAIAQYTAAAEIRGRVGDRRGVATSLRNRARVRVAMGKPGEAEPDLKEARALYQKLGDPRGMADVLDETGVLEERRGRYPAARAAYQEALRLRKPLGDEAQVAQSYDNIGYMYFQEGRYDEAEVYWRQALERRRGLGDDRGLVLSLQNMGFLATAQGKWDAALKSFVDALEAARKSDFKNAMAVSYGNVGVLHHLEGRTTAALASLADALGELKALDDRGGLAEFTLKEAEVLIDVGRLDEARPRLDQAASWVKETGSLEQSADAQRLRGQWHRRRGEAAEASAALAKAVADAEASHSRVALLRARIAAEDVRAVSDAAAVRALLGLVKQADELGDALLRIRAREALAAAQLRHHAGPALATARGAIEIATRVGWHAGLHRLHALAAEAAGPADAAAARRHAAEAEKGRVLLRQGMDDATRRAFDASEAARAAGAARTAEARP